MTTLEKKLHVAGEPKGMIQRCTRCGALLANDGHFWTTGGIVMGYRYGKSLIHTAKQAAGIRLCGKSRKQLFLSNQAGWYLTGNFPVYERPSHGNFAPEPKAMQELVNAGLCVFVRDDLRGGYWSITPLGTLAKEIRQESLKF